jgi:hypothetical protein
MAKDVAVSDEVGSANRPLQVIPYSQKTPEWFKANINSCITRSLFSWGNKSADNRQGYDEEYRDVALLYDVYNNKFPLSWFSHITDPLTAVDPNNKKFPAKIRPVTILRTNIDLLLGEYARRPFIYQVKNMGEDGYSTYQEGLKSQIQDSFKQRFYQAVLQQEEANGRKLSPQEQQQVQQQVPLPDQIQSQFQSSYLDTISIKAQHWLNRKVEECEVKRKLHRGFKHWLIAGEAYSYKGIEHEQLAYREISPLQIDYDKSVDTDFVEDGEWVVCRYLWTASDVVDHFYEYMSTMDQTDLDNGYKFSSAAGFYSSVKGLYGAGNAVNKIPVFHVQWKGRKKIGFLSYLDPETFQYVEQTVDEDYKIDRSRGEQVEWRWVNEVYEGWRIGGEPNSTTSVYPLFRALPCQRSEINNHSACKLSYNGRKYSDLHSQNSSVLEIGIPFQIMYIIVTYILEKTMAKSKGKIFLFDHNSIPQSLGEEKFFYYCEALGYGALNRNQPGVDKTWNQYTVVDMSLFDQIEQLIKLQEYFKQQWDDVLGIARQRKGETYSSDGQGVNERAVFQSTVITDMIFIPYEEFQQRELQGILDFAKFLTAKGERSLIEDDDLGTLAMQIFPEDLALAQLGIRLINATEEQNKLTQARNMAAQMIQAKAKTSQVLEIIDAVNMAELKQKIKELEALDEAISQQTAETQQEHEQYIEKMKEDYLKLEKLLDKENMEAKEDRVDQQLMIKGAFEVAALDRDNNEADTQVATDVSSAIIDHKKLDQDFWAKRQKAGIDREKLTNDIVKQKHDMEMDKKDHEIKKQEVKIKRKVANKPTPRPK